MGEIVETHAWRASSGLVVLVLLAGAACGGSGDDDGRRAAAGGVVEENPGEDADDGDPVEDAEAPGDPEDPGDAAGPALDALGAGPALQVSTPGFDGETIVVGALTPPPGSPDEAATASALAGIEGYVAELNDAGGVLGRHPVEVREESIPEGTGGARAAYEATRDEVLLYVHVPRGAAAALLEPFEADDVVGAPAATGGRWLREQNALAFLTPDEMQVANGIDWALGRAGHRASTADLPLPIGFEARLAGADRDAAVDEQADGADDHVVCAVVPSGGAGGAVAAALRAVARDRGVSVGTVATLPGGDPARAARAAIDRVVADLRSAACETVVLASPPDQTPRVIGAAAGRWYAPRWLGLSWSWTPELATGPLADYARGNLAVVGNGLVDWAPGDDATRATSGEVARAAAALRSARDTHAPDVAEGDLAFALGYTQALVAHQVIDEALAMSDMSRGGVINAINTVDDLHLDGLADDVTYGSPEARRTPRRSAIFGVDPDAPWGLRMVGAPRASISTTVVARELRLR